MATEYPTWRYTRIQGALKNPGHHVGRSTIARILRAEGIPPGRQRPVTWRTFVRAHCSALVAPDFSPVPMRNATARCASSLTAIVFVAESHNTQQPRLA